MADPLKTFFDARLVRRIGESVARVHPTFPLERFVDDAARGLEALELKGRAQQIADALARSLPAHFPDAARVLVASLGEKHATDELEGAGMAPFFYLPHTMFVATAGLDHFEESMAAQYELTQRFTCEFSVRFFLERFPEETLARLASWTKDPSPHVRRLVSEGTRQRLPWAKRVRLLDERPERALALLEALRDDPSSLVRRSVANHLNDLSKSSPDLFYAVCARWLEGASPERRKLVEHALRSAVKRGEARALALLGHGGKPKVAVKEVQIAPRAVRIGDKVRVSLALVSESRRRQSLNVDLEVLFVKARGTSPKVFKLARVDLGPSESIELTKLVSLAVHTTRTPRPGKHDVAVIINGERYPVGAFRVT